MGGHNWVTIDLYMIRLNLLIDVVGAEATPFDLTLKADTVEYSELCGSLGWNFNAI